MGLVFVGPDWTAPLVTFSGAKVLPSSYSDSLFGINQKDYEIMLVSFYGQTEVLESGRTVSGGYDREGGWRDDLLKEHSKRLATLAFRTALAAALDINPQAHQRFPPISPVRQSCPRV